MIDEKYKTFTNRKIARSKYDTTASSDKSVVDRGEEISEKRGILRVHVALDWLQCKAPVTAPIIGATEDAMGHFQLS